MPRLRLVVARYGEDIVGGAERLTRLLAGALHRRGWRVEVLTTRAAEESTWANALPAGRRVEDGVTVERHPVRLRRRPGTFRQLNRGFWRLPPQLRPETAWLTLQGPWSPGLEAALRAAPDVATLFVTYLYRPTLWGMEAVRGPRLLLPTAHDERPLQLRRVGRMLATVDGILYATPEERDLVDRVHPAAAGKPAEIGNVAIEAPTGVDAESFRVARGLQGPYLIYGGRTTAGKGMDELLAAFRALRRTHPQARLALSGEAGERTAPEPGVVLLGTLTEAARWEAVAGAAAVVVPSFHESLSLLALEGWAMGRPALLNGASPVLAGQALRSGGGVTYRGAPALAAAAAALLDQPDRAAALGARGRAHVLDAYTWDAVLGRLERLLDGAAPAALRRGAVWR